MPPAHHHLAWILSAGGSNGGVTAREPAILVQVKVERAREHLGNLERTILASGNKRNYVVIGDPIPRHDLRSRWRPLRPYDRCQWFVLEKYGHLQYSLPCKRRLYNGSHLEWDMGLLHKWFLDQELDHHVCL